MALNTDWKEFLELLVSCGVEFLIVGAWARAFYAEPRVTGDIDIWVRSTPENAHRVVEAIARFGFASLGLTEADFSGDDQVIQFGFPPRRIGAGVIGPASYRAFQMVALMREVDRHCTRAKSGGEPPYSSRPRLSQGRMQSSVLRRLRSPSELGSCGDDVSERMEQSGSRSNPGDCSLAEPIGPNRDRGDHQSPP